MSAADITAAAVTYRVRTAQPFPPPAALAGLRDWEDRVTAFDRHLRAAGS